ncbi:MAG: hypothetical protein ACYC6Z_10560 [Thermoleophilia bacterium]
MKERGRNRQDMAIAASLFVLTVLSRIPFRTTMLYSWDSILYARAIGHFDVAAQQPQPPGYIFYVGLISLVHKLVPDENAAIVWVSVFASAAATAALFWLGRMMYGRRVGLMAALFLITSLSFWVHSEVALPYTLLGFLGIASAAVIYNTWQGDVRYVIPAAAVLGLASGFRQDLLFFLLPIFVAGLVGKPRSRVLPAIAVLGAGVLSWFLPTVMLSGGLSAYQAAAALQSNYVVGNASFLGRDGILAVFDNLNFMARFFFWAAAGALPLVGAAVFRFLSPRSRPPVDRRVMFLAAWALPSMIVYIFIHIGEPGYVFSFLPAVLLLAVWGVDDWLKRVVLRLEHVQGLRIFVYAPLALVVCNLALFLFISPKMSAASLARRDRTLSSEIASIRERFDPASTLIVAVYDERHVSYYLPEYPRVKLDPMVKENVNASLDPQIKQVVIFDDYLESAAAQTKERLTLGAGQSLVYISRAPGQKQVTLDWNNRTVALVSGG